MVVAPVVLDLAISGRARAFGYLAADAFYYLTIARNAVEHGGKLTYDTIHGTNGFHPLWQLILVVVFALAKLFRVAEWFTLGFVVALNAAMLGAAVYLLGRALYPEERAPSPLLALFPVGVYVFFLLPIWTSATVGFGFDNPFEGWPPLYGTLWSWANGMESSLLLLLFAIAAWVFARKRPLESDRGAALVGVLLSLFTLARLDHGLIAAVVVLGVLLSARSLTELRRALLVAALFAAPLALYCAINRLALGVWLPVSGAVKTTFPTVNRVNLLKTVEFFKHPLSNGWWRVYREAQIVVPILFAVPFALVIGVRRIFRRAVSPLDGFLALISLGAIALAAYDNLYVDLPHHGHWYFPVSIVLVTLIFLRALDGAGRWLGARKWAAVSTVALCVALGGFFFVRYQRREIYHSRYAELYFRDAPRLREKYGSNPPHLLEIDDGIVAFSTGFPTMSGSGLALDPEGFDAYRRGRLQDLALKRGFDRVTSLTYFVGHRMSMQSSSWDVGMGVRGNPARFNYQMEFLADAFFVARVWKK